MRRPPAPLRPSFALATAFAVAALAGCAHTGAVGSGAVANGAAIAPASAASAPASAAPAAGQPQPFASVVRGAKEISGGLFPTWQRDERFWIELKPEDFNRPLFLSPKLARGIGEAGLYGGSMRFSPFARALIVEFRRVHNQVQLVAPNLGHVAVAGTPEGRAVAAAFSPSLLASTPVASQPHPERKTVLVDAGALFLGDMFGMATVLNRAYRQSYSLDRANTAIVGVRGKPGLLVLETQAHYAAASLAVPQPGAPSGAPAPTTPSSLPDPRSLFLGLHYSLSTLPDEPMVPRRADARLGHFTTAVHDFGDDLARTPRVRWVNRWRLEKKDPTAALSEPVKPITFWIDRTVPLKYRDAIGRGILEWNKAFERIGFRNAIVVQVQPDDADFDTLDMGVASVRWMTNAQATYGAIGPSHVDPRSGEILDADIAFESLSSRNLRAVRSQILAGRAANDWAALMQHGGDAAHDHELDTLACRHADFAAEQMAYALDVLEARGDLDADSPEAQRFVLDYLTDVSMHEVGHTLGLRHNFRSSRIYNERQLSDPEFTRSHGLAGSVMEYAPVNLPRPGERGGTEFQLALGPYDYWAVEYAYKPIAAEHETAELQRIAARSGEPELAFGTDEDNFLGIDPESLVFDLGDDALAFARKRIDIARDLVRRQESRPLDPNEDYSVLRRGVTFALRDVGRAAGILTRQIGGVRTLRDFPGTGRDPLQPVPAAVQRESLDVLARHLLAADSVLLSPSLQRRLAPDFNERSDALYGGEAAVSTDFSLPTMLLDMQRSLLGQLMSDAVAARILDSEGKVGRGARPFRLSELVGRLTRDVWSELDGRGDIAASRRELQREHLNRLAALLVKPGTATRADARSLWRAEAKALQARIDKASRRGGLSAEARAHLSDSAETLSQALNARLQKAAA